MSPLRSSFGISLFGTLVSDIDYQSEMGKMGWGFFRMFDEEKIVFDKQFNINLQILN